MKILDVHFNIFCAFKAYKLRSALSKSLEGYIVTPNYNISLKQAPIGTPFHVLTVARSGKHLTKLWCDNKQKWIMFNAYHEEKAIWRKQLTTDYTSLQK